MSPPGETKYGLHAVAVVLTPFIFMNALGFFIGYT
jgi:hypothetical protein